MCHQVTFTHVHIELEFKQFDPLLLFLDRRTLKFVDCLFLRKQSQTCKKDDACGQRCATMASACESDAGSARREQGEKNEAIGGAVEHDFGGGGSTSSSLARVVHGGNVRGFDKCISGRGRAGGGIFVWSTEVWAFAGSFSGSEDRRIGGAKHGLGKGKPKFKGMAGNGETSIKGAGANSQAEGRQSR
jgi:hypothetical protein